MQYEMKKKVHIICPVITLPLWKFWRWLRSSYPGTEKGQWFITSLEQDIQKVKNVVQYRMCGFCGQYHSQTFCIVWTHQMKEFLFNLHCCQKRKIIQRNVCMSDIIMLKCKKSSPELGNYQTDQLSTLFLIGTNARFRWLSSIAAWIICAKGSIQCSICRDYS